MADGKRKLTRSEDFFIGKVLRDTPIERVMTPDVAALPVDAPFHRVVEILHERGIRHLPVIDREKRVVGLITQRDLYKIQSPRRREDGTFYYDAAELDHVRLEHVMNRSVFTLRPSQPVADAIEPMVRFKYGCVILVDEKGVLKGILTQHDILKMAALILEEGTDGEKRE